MVKMIEHDPNYFGKPIADTALEITAHQRQASRKREAKNVALIICVLCGLASVACIGMLVGSYDSENDAAYIFGLVLIGSVFLFSFFASRNWRKEMCAFNFMIQQRQQTIASLEQQNVMDTRIGNYIICPHCEATLEYVPLGSPPTVEGLKHCLKCGRQFFTSGLNSYPVLFKK